MLHGIATADWHLDAMKSHFPADHIDRQMVMLEKIYEHAIDKGIEHIFVNGDVFDSSVSPIATCISLLRLFSKYRKHVTTHVLAGNHDWADIRKTALDFLQDIIQMNLLKNVYVYKEFENKTIEGININFIPFGTENYSPSKKASLNFLHQAVSGAIGDNGRKLKVGANDFKSRKKDFCFLGHVHKYQFLESRRMVYSGAPYQKTFGEDVHKGFVEFKAKMDGNKLNVIHKFVTLKQEFELRTVLIKNQKDFQKLSNSYNVRLRLVIVGEDVVVPSDLTATHSNIATVINSKGVKVTETDSSVKLNRDRVTSIPKINPTKGLAKLLKAHGHSKADIKLAKKIVEDSLNIS